MTAFMTPDQLHEKVIRLLGGVNPSLRGEIANTVDALRETVRTLEQERTMLIETLRRTADELAGQRRSERLSLDIRNVSNAERNETIRQLGERAEQTETDLAALRKERDELRLNFQEAVGGPLTPLAEDIDSAGMEANEFQREAVVSALRQLSALRQAHARLQEEIVACTTENHKMADLATDEHRRAEQAEARWRALKDWLTERVGHYGSRSAVAGVLDQMAALDLSRPTPPTLVNTGKWFVERQHPDKHGFTQVNGPLTDAESANVLSEWTRQRPDLNPHRWEHIVASRPTPKDGA